MAVLALAVAAGCDSKKEAVMTSGIDLTNLDTTAVQGADFYQYACGGWMKKHPLTSAIWSTTRSCWIWSRWRSVSC